MGALVDAFGGKISGELIRASDWNGMLAGVESLVAALQASVESRLAPLEAAVSDLTPRVAGLEARVADLEALATSVRQRFRRVNLSAPTTTFAIGQRGVVSAAVASLDGSPLDLSDPATRPWVDFVTLWGTLKAAPGFISRGGAGDQTLSVQVNASGVASVLVRAGHAEAFAEEEELEVEAALNTQVIVAGQAMRTHEAFLAAATPTSETVRPAFRAMTAAYQRTDTTVMRRYLDAHYVLQPSRTVGVFAPLFRQRWRDYRATVLAFVKPDADPVSPDGAMASGSIQVTFRDWISPWIVDDFLSDIGDVVTQYQNRFPPLVRPEFASTVDGFFNEIDRNVRDEGVLGRQRQYRAAETAVRALNLPNAPSFFGDLVDAVGGGIGVQRSLSFSDAVTPNADTAPTAARALAGSSAKATGEATRVGDALSARFDAALASARSGLRDEVLTQQRLFHSELLKEDGPIAGAQRDARDVRGALDSFNRALRDKADFQFVADIVRQRPG